MIYVLLLYVIQPRISTHWYKILILGAGRFPSNRNLFTDIATSVRRVCMMEDIVDPWEILAMGGKTFPMYQTDSIAVFKLLMCWKARMWFYQLDLEITNFNCILLLEVLIKLVCMMTIAFFQLRKWVRISIFCGKTNNLKRSRNIYHRFRTIRLSILVHNEYPLQNTITSVVSL